MLYVEDNPADVALVKTALRPYGQAIELTVAQNGSVALERLRQQGIDKATPLPHVILLDLNLPGITGEDVLVAIKTDSRLKILPVIIFSSGANQNLCAPVYREYASSCIQKPAELDAFISAVASICDYWFRLTTLPD